MLSVSRMTFRVFLLASILAFVLVSSSSVMAQDVATGSATATIVTALTVTATSPLAFGTTYQGVQKTIARTVAEAGIFTIGGQANSGISGSRFNYH
mgnify:CR=1 FL=1